MDMRGLRLAATVLAFFICLRGWSQQTPVSDAAHAGHPVGHEMEGVRAIQAALAAGGNVNERDKSGWTPLMHAALECRAEEVKLLLDKGADPNLQGRAVANGGFMESGQTAMLLSAGCFIARRRAQLAPERHMPADYAGYELAAPAKMVRELIDHGARVDVADVLGRTPLMMAAMQGWTEVVHLLLRAHADVRARDRARHTVLDFVGSSDHATRALLQKAGAPPASGHSGRTVCDAQAALKMTIVDCIGGSQFASALRKFQQEHKLPATGNLDRATLQGLGVRP